MSRLLLAWLLMVPLVVLAVHMQFSFMNGIRNSDEGQMLATQITAPDNGMLPIVRVFFYPTYVMIAWLLFANQARVRRIALQYKPALLICGIVLSSVTWSQAPRSSLNCGFYYFVDTLFAFYLLVAFNLEELMDLTMMLGSTVAVLSAVMIVGFPQYGLMHLTNHLNEWQGIFSQKNVAAYTCVFLLTPVCNRRILRPSCALYAGTILLFIFMTHSVTAIVIVPVYVVFTMCLPFYRRAALRSVVFLLVATILLAVMLALLLFDKAPQLALFFGRDLTLSGRTDMWALLLQSAQKRPLLGYGYAAFWTGMDGESGQFYMATHWFVAYAHNGFLEILLQVGLIGLAAVVFMIVKAIADAFVCVRNENSEGIDWLVGLLFLTLLYNLDEGTILYPHSLVSVFFVITCGGLTMARARIPGRTRNVKASLGYEKVDSVDHA
jgi:O-antigen ligase